MTLETVLVWIVIGAVAGVLAQSMVGGTNVEESRQRSFRKQFAIILLLSL